MQSLLSISGAVVGAVCLVLLALAPKIIKATESLVSSLQAHVKGTMYQTTLTHALSVIESLVLDVENDVTSMLSTQQGPLTKAEVDVFVAKVVQQATSIIGSQGIGILHDFVGDTEAWLNTHVRPRVVAAIKKAESSNRLVADVIENSPLGKLVDVTSQYPSVKAATLPGNTPFTASQSVIAEVASELKEKSEATSVSAKNASGAAVKSSK